MITKPLLYFVTWLKIIIILVRFYSLLLYSILATLSHSRVQTEIFILLNDRKCAIK